MYEIITTKKKFRGLNSHHISQVTTLLAEHYNRFGFDRSSILMELDFCSDDLL
jgi:hypothetical protein